MTIDEKDLVKAGMEIALKPFTDVVSDGIAISGGAWIKEQRVRITARLKQETEEILKRRGVKEPIEPSPSVAVPLLEAAQDESREELLSLWAKLAAAATDPNRAKHYRRQYIDIVKMMEPIDVPILDLLPQQTDENQRSRIARKLNLQDDQVTVSFLNLIEIGIAELPVQYQIASGAVFLTPLGNEFLRLMRDAP